jgi:hypothetical protein
MMINHAVFDCTLRKKAPARSQPMLVDGLRVWGMYKEARFLRVVPSRIVP